MAFFYTNRALGAVVVAIASTAPVLAAEQIQNPAACFGLDWNLLTIAIREQMCGIPKGADDEAVAVELEKLDCPAKVIDEFWTTLRRVRSGDYRGLQINPAMMKELVDGFGGCQAFTDPAWSERNP